jgi:hypothetical protein
VRERGRERSRERERERTSMVHYTPSFGGYIHALLTVPDKEKAKE